MSTLGGSIFCYNAVSQDYCIKESIKCLQEFCDSVAVVDAGSTDDTPKLLKGLENGKTSILILPNELWQKEKGKEKLSIFSNMAHNMLSTDYFFNLQADEILHENSYDAIRKAIETGEEAFLVKRINLWKDCFHQLNVPQEKKPCSTEIIRLAKKGYQSFDDAENLYAQAVYWFIESIKIIHYGFIRKKEVMPDKIRHMQGEVFGMQPDVKLEGMINFDPYKWFTDEDLIPFNDHPKIMKEWIKTRP